MKKENIIVVVIVLILILATIFFTYLNQDSNEEIEYTKNNEELISISQETYNDLRDDHLDDAFNELELLEFP